MTIHTHVKVLPTSTEFHMVRDGNKHTVVTVRAGLLTFRSYYAGAELKRVRQTTDAASFYKWLGHELLGGRDDG